MWVLCRGDLLASGGVGVPGKGFLWGPGCPRLPRSSPWWPARFSCPLPLLFRLYEVRG